MPLDLSTPAADGHGQHLDEGLGGFGLLAASTHAHRIDRVVLDLGRQRLIRVTPGWPGDLADLVDADLGLAGLDQVGHVAALLQLRLRLHLVGDAELDQQVRHIDAARGHRWPDRCSRPSWRPAAPS